MALDNDRIETLTKRLELSFLKVLAFPKDSSKGLLSKNISFTYVTLSLPATLTAAIYSIIFFEASVLPAPLSPTHCHSFQSEGKKKLTTYDYGLVLVLKQHRFICILCNCIHMGWHFIRKFPLIRPYHLIAVNAQVFVGIY